MPDDIIILTEDRYWKPDQLNDYISNILLEDQLLMNALQAHGLRCDRLPWSHPDYDWSQTKAVIFRTTWDYFDRLNEFTEWLAEVKRQTSLINPASLIEWNIDKHYLLDIQAKGANIPPSQFIEKGETASLKEWQVRTGWDPFILKPAVSGAGRHTYKLTKESLHEKEELFASLISEESMLIQQFMTSVPVKGEVSFMLIDGYYTHAVLKKAREGDFRVQDDFGGSVQNYKPTKSEIEWAETIFSWLEPTPAYGRVDAIWDNDDQLCVSELELIEPEMWFRYHPEAAKQLAKVCFEIIRKL